MMCQPAAADQFHPGTRPVPQRATWEAQARAARAAAVPSPGARLRDLAHLDAEIADEQRAYDVAMREGRYRDAAFCSAHVGALQTERYGRLLKLGRPARG